MSWISSIKRDGEVKLRTPQSRVIDRGKWWSVQIMLCYGATITATWPHFVLNNVSHNKSDSSDSAAL